MPIQVEHEGQTITAYTEDEVQQRVNDEVAGLKTTNQQLKDEKQQLKDSKDQLQGQINEAEEAKRQAEEDRARRDGDYQKLEELMNSRLESERQERERIQREMASERIDNALGDVVHRLGAGGTKNEDLRDLIKTRFSFEYDSESGQIKVAGDGVESLESLEKQISESGRYDAYLAGSQASGGGAPGSQGGGPATKNPQDMTEAERVDLFKSDPQKFRELFGT